MKYFLNRADRDLFYSRNDPKDRRLGELVSRVSIDEIKPEDVVIIGIPEDRGITANKGRAGASKAPDDIRRRFYRLTPGFTMDFNRISVVDAGNLRTDDMTLEGSYRGTGSCG